MNRALKYGALAITAFGATGSVGGGCVDRNVVSNKPSTETIVSKTITNKQIDKIDLLFVIDNSASMGDKQKYLEKAVPDLIARLVDPNCVDPNSGAVYGPSTNGQCAQGGKVEFPPVHDLHLGLISTSLGARLSGTYPPPGSSDAAPTTGAICDPDASYTVNGGTTHFSYHNDDKGELLNRTDDADAPLPAAGSSYYLNYFPNVPANANKQPSPGAPVITDAGVLVQDFTQLVEGVGTLGCGIESQLESWYRFLVQPDPYKSLALDANHKAQWVDVDETILKQRHDFLRPDSLVAIIDLTDENDSEIDVRSYGGEGYAFMNQPTVTDSQGTVSNGFDPTRGTSGCAENAAGSGLVDASACTSCGYGTSDADPSCKMGEYSLETDWGENMNLRHVHMMQKYGVWPQFPIERYVTGLTSQHVPDRSGEYPAGAYSYQGLTHLNCVNPLFAASLPDGSSTDPATLCNLPLGPRTPDLVYFAHIGGVPHQLLQQDPADAGSPQKETLASSDWLKILGRDPEHEDYTGADPHMIESYQPRPDLPAPTSAPAGGNPDPISGREWFTDQGQPYLPLAVDREYACTFTLETPRDCTDSTQALSCDCPTTDDTLAYDQVPPICAPPPGSSDSRNHTQQIAAKAYPTVRELLLAKEMGNQGIVSSLCPIHVTAANGDSPPDPLFGYRPAMNAIVDRLKVSLNAECAPEKLAPAPSLDGAVTGAVSCTVLVALPAGTGGGTCTHPGAACDPKQGLVGPTTDPAKVFTQSLLDDFCATHTQPGADPQITADQPVCSLDQVLLDPSNTRNCAAVPDAGAGWCYVQGPAATALGCQQPNTIVFTNGEPPSGTVASLQCLESAVDVTGSGGTPDGG